MDNEVPEFQKEKMTMANATGEVVLIPDGYGLHDMQGNVVEWVWDFYDPDYYSSSPSANPRGPESVRFRPEPVRFRVVRGGGWHSGPYCSRVYYRNALPANWVDFNVGFRCAERAR